MNVMKVIWLHLHGPSPVVDVFIYIDLWRNRSQSRDGDVMTRSSLRHDDVNIERARTMTR